MRRRELNLPVGLEFGELVAGMTRVPTGVVVERFETLRPSFTVTGTGHWMADEEGQRTALEAEIVTTNLLATSEDLGYRPDIKADAGRAVLDVRWPGPPDGHFVEHISGNVRLEIGKGQIINVQPGAGRVLGLLSLSALPRRLSLDFRDVFQKGLGFDSIKGDFLLEDGHAYTSNLMLVGPAADIGVVGRAGLALRDYDQTAVVRTNLGSTLPLAGVIAGGPIIGGALLIFTEMFKRPMKGIARVSYRVTGSWDEPVIERVSVADGEGSTATAGESS